MKSSIYYFHLKTKVMADFQICFSVPLSFLMFSDETLIQKFNVKLLKFIHFNWLKHMKKSLNQQKYFHNHNRKYLLRVSFTRGFKRGFNCLHTTFCYIDVSFC